MLFCVLETYHFLMWTRHKSVRRLCMIYRPYSAVEYVQCVVTTVCCKCNLQFCCMRACVSFESEKWNIIFLNLDLTQVQHDCNIKQREFLSNHYARLNIFKLDSELSASSFVCSSLKRTWNISCKYVCNIIPFCSYWYRQWHWFKVFNNPRPQNFHLRNWAIFLKSYKSSVWPVGSRIYQHLAIYNNENSHNRINF